MRYATEGGRYQHHCPLIMNASNKNARRIALVAMGFPFVVLSAAPALAQADFETTTPTAVVDETTTVVDDPTTTVVDDSTTTVEDDPTTTTVEDDPTTTTDEDDPTTTTDEDADVDEDNDDTDTPDVIVDGGASLTIQLLGGDVDGLTVNLLDANGDALSTSTSNDNGVVTFDLNDLPAEDATYEVQVESDRNIVKVTAEVTEVETDVDDLDLEEALDALKDILHQLDVENGIVQPTDTPVDDSTTTPVDDSVTTTAPVDDVDLDEVASDLNDLINSVDTVDASAVAATTVFDNIDISVLDGILQDYLNGAGAGDANDDQLGNLINNIESLLSSNGDSPVSSTDLNSIISSLNDLNTGEQDAILDTIADVNPETIKNLLSSLVNNPDVDVDVENPDDDASVVTGEGTELEVEISAEGNGFTFTASSNDIITADVTLEKVDNKTAQPDDDTLDPDGNVVPGDDDDKDDTYGPKVKTGGSIATKGIFSLFS